MEIKYLYFKPNQRVFKPLTNLFLYSVDYRTNYMYIYKNITFYLWFWLTFIWFYLAFILDHKSITSFYINWFFFKVFYSSLNKSCEIISRRKNSWKKEKGKGEKKENNRFQECEFARNDFFDNFFHELNCTNF